MSDIDTLEFFGDSVCAIKDMPYLNKSRLDMYIPRSLRPVFFLHPSEPVEAHEIIDNLSAISIDELDEMVRWSTYNILGQSMLLSDVMEGLGNCQSGRKVVQNLNEGEFELFFSYAEKPPATSVDTFLKQFSVLGGYDLNQLQEFVYGLLIHAEHKLANGALTIFYDGKPMLGFKLIGATFIVADCLRTQIPIQFMMENRVPRRDFYFGDLNFCLSEKNFSTIFGSINPTQNPHR